jgi:alginate O-acetyltransferase complex protein AlgI
VDFSGYSDIARGVIRLFGVKLMVNFDQPYLSRSAAEFWRRWHISLSTWLRDYLYISLGGNRRSTARTYANLMLTMLLGGLWHGASWNFVIWGGLHGLFLVLHRLWRSIRRGVSSDRDSRWTSRLAALGGCILTILVVLITWIFFRAPDLPTAVAVLNNMVDLLSNLDGALFAAHVLFCYASAILAIDLAPYLIGRHEATLTLPVWAQTFVHACLALWTWAAWPEQNAAFIYFQF